MLRNSICNSVCLSSFVSQVRSGLTGWNSREFEVGPLQAPSQAEASMHLLDLPHQLLVRILSHLRSHRQLATAAATSSVCRSLHAQAVPVTLVCRGNRVGQSRPESELWHPQHVAVAGSVLLVTDFSETPLRAIATPSSGALLPALLWTISADGPGETSPKPSEGGQAFPQPFRRALLEWRAKGVALHRENLYVAGIDNTHRLLLLMSCCYSQYVLAIRTY